MLWKLLLLQGAPLLKTGLVQAFLFPKGLKPARPTYSLSPPCWGIDLLCSVTLLSPGSSYLWPGSVLPGTLYTS